MRFRNNGCGRFSCCLKFSSLWTCLDTEKIKRKRGFWILLIFNENRLKSFFFRVIFSVTKQSIKVLYFWSNQMPMALLPAPVLELARMLEL